VPLHVYAGDVYQGSATPVTAFLSFVPKTSGIVALIKVLYAVGGPHWALPPIAVKLLWVVAVLTMSIGNAIATTHIHQVKRLFAYSSIAHSGYMLVGITALAGAYGSGAKDPAGTQAAALQGVLFYLAAYGVSNAAAFGVLMMLPSRETHDAAERPGVSAETMRDLAGQGRHHPQLGLCMMVCCMSLTGIPLTVGFIGKLMLIKPALGAGFNWLAAITVVNAAVSAAYYLRIVSTMFLSDPHLAHGQHEPPPPRWSLPIGTSVALSVVGAVLLGTALPLTQVVSEGARRAAQLDDGTVPPTPVADVAAAARCPLEVTHVSRR
jgi:NADH-quinone oxidoreductase subunit N